MSGEVFVRLGLLDALDDQHAFDLVDEDRIGRALPSAWMVTVERPDAIEKHHCTECGCARHLMPCGCDRPDYLTLELEPRADERLRVARALAGAGYPDAADFVDAMEADGAARHDGARAAAGDDWSDCDEVPRLHAALRSCERAIKDAREQWASSVGARAEVAWATYSKAVRLIYEAVCWQCGKPMLPEERGQVVHNRPACLQCALEKSLKEGVR